ncbi:MAG: potassium channel family protein [Prochlorococcus sp.]
MLKITRKPFKKERLYGPLLILLILVVISFAFPSLSHIGWGGYSLIAILLNSLLSNKRRKPTLSDRVYKLLVIVALISLWIWLLTPIQLIYSGIPLALSWSVLVGWSVLRLLKQLNTEDKVNCSVLMGASAGYLLIGLTAGLVMSAVETIQPGSFQPLQLPSGFGGVSDLSVISAGETSAEINYFAFVCLTTVGFGDITPQLPIARMLSVATSIIGTLYLAVVMGVLIGRLTNQSLKRALPQNLDQQRRSEEVNGDAGQDS